MLSTEKDCGKVNGHKNHCVLGDRKQSRPKVILDYKFNILLSIKVTSFEKKLYKITKKKKEFPTKTNAA